MAYAAAYQVAYAFRVERVFHDGRRAFVLVSVLPERETFRPNSERDYGSKSRDGHVTTPVPA